MTRGPTGSYRISPSVGGEVVRAFVPAPLPPQPELQIDALLREEVDQALLALGRLDSVSTLLPDTALFLSMYIRKEAVLSSQIEGTQSSLSDLLLFEIDEAPGAPFDDVREVSNYVRGIELGLRKVRTDLPLSNRLLRDIHRVLLAKGRGAAKEPGEFRRSQNWVGGPRPALATYVPPPPDLVADCMSDLEKFLNDQPVRTATLIKVALAHVQFESIHPFLDGNGRLGRLLITLLLCAEGVLREPLLYLSLYLKTHRAEYYALLQRVRLEGDWESWFRFFVLGVRETADQAVQTARRLVTMFRDDRETIEAGGHGASSALRVHHALQKQPLLSIARARAKTKLSVPTITSAFRRLEKAGIVRETTGKKRSRLFAYDRYLAVLNEGTGPL